MRVRQKPDHDTEIMLYKLTRKEAEIKEIEFINLYKRFKDGGTLCNITLGGDGSFGLRGKDSPNFGKKYSKERVENMKKGLRAAITQETRDKIRRSAIGRVVSEETKIKLRQKALKGKDHPKFGIPLSEETKQKIRNKNIGRILSQETKDKMSESMKLRGSVSPETIVKMKLAAVKRWEQRRLFSLQK